MHVFSTRFLVGELFGKVTDLLEVKPCRRKSVTEGGLSGCIALPCIAHVFSPSVLPFSPLPFICRALNTCDSSP